MGAELPGAVGGIAKHLGACWFIGDQIGGVARDAPLSGPVTGFDVLAGHERQQRNRVATIVIVSWPSFLAAEMAA